MKRAINYLCGILALGLLHHPLLGQTLSGNYSIGNATGTEDYPTLSAAIADLKAGTIAGDVQYNIGTGTYNETMNLSDINNGAFTITFAGASKEFTIIHPMGDIAVDKSGISITNTNNVVLKNFTLEMDDISDAEVYFDENETKGINISGAEHIDLEDLLLSNANYVFVEDDDTDFIASAVSLVDVNNISISSSTFGGTGTLIYLDDFTNVSITTSGFSEGKSHIYHKKQSDVSAEALTISQNTFTGPYFRNLSVGAITLNALFDGNRGTNLTIEDNVFDVKVVGSSETIHGILLNGWDGAAVRGNTIEGGSEGIYVFSCNSCELTSNQVYNTSNTGIKLQSNTQIDVINNVVTSSTGRGIQTLSLNDLRLIHNTIHSGTLALSIFNAQGDHIDILNNIFSIESTGSTEVWINTISATEIKMDHNLYSGNASTNTVIAYNLGSGSGVTLSAVSFSDWQTGQALYDQNSQSFDPIFAGAEDYHITDATSYRFGTAIADVTTDIDGDYRDEMDGIDVGADQFCNPACAAPVNPPAISSFTPTSGPIGSGIIINGANFDPTPANNVVTIGGVQATVLSASATSLSVIVPAGAVSGPVAVLANGLIDQSGVHYQVTFESDGTIADEGFAISDVIFPEARLDRFDQVTLASGDLDGDGLVDLIAANRSDSSVAVFRNISSGYDNINFENRLIFPTAGEPNELVLEDFDGDGKLDIAVGQQDSTHFSVFRNTSTTGISMAARQDFQTPGHTFSIAAGDLDGDGKIDMATIIKDSSEVMLFKNTSTIGSIHFSNQVTYGTGDTPVDIKVEDVDQDEVPDVLVISSTENALSVFLNDGAMNLAPKVDFETSSRPNHLAAGDIDGDGVLDLAVATQSGIRIFGNSSSVGSLSFTALDVGNTATKRLLLSDINGDSSPDLVSIDDDIKIKKNNSSVGAISFDTDVSMAPEVGPISLHVGDFNHDGEPDITTSGWATSFFDYAVEIFRNLGSGNSFTSFSLDAQAAPATIDLENHTISIDVMDCTNPASLIPDFTLSPLATATVEGVTQQSGVTANDYAGVLTYLVTAEDGSAQIWTVTVNATRFAEHVVENVTACSSYEFDGVELTTSGAYQALFTNKVGCDSVVDLNLTIRDGICWEAGIWSNEAGPTLTDNAILISDYHTSTAGSLSVVDIEVEAGVTLYVEDGDLVDITGDVQNDGDIIVNSGGTLLLYEGLEFAGNDVFAKRNTRYADGRYSMVGSPLQYFHAINGEVLGEHVYQYDETVPYSTGNAGLDKWVDASLEGLIPGRGYTQANRQEIVFEGLPNVGTVVYSGTYTMDDGTHEGFNLVSNPYTAALDIDEFLTINTNIAGAVYLWDDNGSNTQRGTDADYIVANAITALNTTPAGGESRYNTAVGTAQGFFVKLTGAASTDITFTESMRLDGSNSDDNFFRVEETPLVRINLTNEEGLFKQTVLGWREDGSDTELIRQYDAPIFGLSGADLIYTIKADQPLAIQIQPTDWTEVPLGINTTEAGSYKLSVEGEAQVYLKDHQTGKIIDLLSGSYEFTTRETGPQTERFSLLSTSEPILGVDPSASSVFGVEGLIYIIQPEADERTYHVFNLNGQLLLSRSVSASTFINPVGLAPGIYLVNDGQTTHKIILE